MSRVGKKHIPVPKGVQVAVSGQQVTVKGPKGTLVETLLAGVIATVENDEIVITLATNLEVESKMHGLYRALISNMVTGVTTGFTKKLEMIGVGFRAAVQGKVLDLQLGFSHPTRLDIPTDLQVSVDKNTIISITGSNKQHVGQFAAEVRSMRPPEPYKGKGIRYEGEYVRKKAGKTGKGK
ncbi:MAG: ribosomal protein [Chlamydiales bacterium]|jgi:large subunit ribosomal protein L6|nr:ribosomal protein [Chlamydiales bacterium]